MDDFCEKQKCDVVVIMTLINNEEGKPERQMAVYSQNRIFRDQVWYMFAKLISLGIRVGFYGGEERVLGWGGGYYNTVKFVWSL